LAGASAHRELESEEQITMGSSRIGLCVQGLAVTFLAAFAGCSSSPSPIVTGPMGDGGGGGDGAVVEADMDGTGADCTPQNMFTTATHITVHTTWPASLAVNGCTASSTPPCTAPFEIWLLTNYTITGTTVAAKSQTCESVNPPVTLNATGNIATGVPDGMTGQVENTLPPAVWKSDKQPITDVTGAIGGWKTGASIRIDKSTQLEGIAPTSTLANPDTAWPNSAAGIPMADLVDSDGDGPLGITGVPLSGNGFYLPHVSVNASSAAADRLYIVSRTTLRLFGHSTSCTEWSGDAFVTQLQNHIIGCRQQDTMMDCTTGDPNMGSGFIDANTTRFIPGAGTFESKQIPAGSNCDTVLSTFPPANPAYAGIQ
jgi:hypothetical protein